MSGWRGEPARSPPSRGLHYTPLLLTSEGQGGGPFTSSRPGNPYSAGHCRHVLNWPRLQSAQGGDAMPWA